MPSDPPARPGPSDPSRPAGLRPSRVWYWVAGLIALVGILAAVAWGVLSFLRVVHRVDGFRRVSVPGETVITFVKPGDFTLYYERRGREGSAGPRVTLVAVDGSGPVALAPYHGRLTYDFGYRGRALRTFRIRRAGAYRLTARPQFETASSGGGEVAVGAGLGRLIVSGVVGTLALGLVGVAAGTALAVVTAVRRHSASRAGRAPARPGRQGGAQARPAGWYPDPGDASSQRWWDGRAWTGHVSPPA